MIVVFVVDTSPSMMRPAVGDSGMSCLDLAKMTVEDLCRGLKKRVVEHGRMLQEQDVPTQRSLHQAGLGMVNQDTLLLLSTSLQHPDTSACAAGGRLLVGFGTNPNNNNNNNSNNGADPTTSNTLNSNNSNSNSNSNSNAAVSDPLQDPAASFKPQQHMESFQRELKSLQATKWDPSTGTPFPSESGGGATGLNAALSAGLNLLSRYRLQNRLTENFGMGRLPSTAILTTNGNQATAALQPACLVLITDGACLRQSQELGGGPLKLQYGAQPLKDFYIEPFRWDQRIFCLGVGGREGVSSSQHFHPQLRALCEVTGGSHWMVRNSGTLQQVTDAILKRISPPLPRELPIQDPLFQRAGNSSSSLLPVSPLAPVTAVTVPAGSSFVSGGPVCCFQALEAEEGGRPPVKLRAMLLYTASTATCNAQRDAQILSSPLWCIPESFYPSKKLDTLPPRQAQPLLYFSKYPFNLGGKSFEPIQVIKMLHRLDQLIAANRKITGQTAKYLHRDVYVCEWLAPEGGKPVPISISNRVEYFPVFVPGAGRPMSEDTENYLNIGILHVPANCSTLACLATPNRLATLTLLPPEPHILLPLLIRAAEAENRLLTKLEASKNAAAAAGGTKTGLAQKQALAKAVIPIDDHWRSEFRAYMFRLPPYYQLALKRALRSVLPTSAHSLLHIEAMDSLALQCYSVVCAQKIRNGEQIARDFNERLERQEAGLRRQGAAQSGDLSTKAYNDEKPLKYGQFDTRTSTDSYLAALRNMPAPWRVGTAGQRTQENKKGREGKSDTASDTGDDGESPKSIVDTLGDLPATCLMAYYESRRRWIFGGTGLTTRGIIVEGVNNDGTNSQCGRPGPDNQEESLLSFAGVGVSSLNQTTTTKMGDYRERLLFSRSPVVGCGSNDAAGVSATTAIDGSPTWSVDDDALPMTFFNPQTGEFADSVQARVRSRLMVNFGNPFKEKRANSLIPEKFLSQAPPTQQGGFGSAPGSPRSPPGSPPHDSFESVEEGEAVFVRATPSRKSPKREEPPDDIIAPPPPKRPRVDAGVKTESKPEPPKPPESRPPVPKTLAAPPLPPKPTGSGTPRQPPPPRPPKKAGTGKTPLGKSPVGKAPTGKAPPPPPRPPPPPPKQSTPQPPPASPALPKPTLPPVDAPPLPKQNTLQPPPASPVKQKPSLSLPDDAGMPLSPEKEVSRAIVALPSDKDKTVPLPLPPLSDLDLECADVKPKVELPPGWICVWSKSQKRWYFFDTKTNKSVWKWPP